MAGRRGLPSAGLVLALAVALAGPVPAQEPAQPPPEATPFLFVNQERLLTGSRRGQALLASEEAARDRLRAEARAIDSAFEAEERELTEARASLEPDAFRALADDFDARVVAARREQDNRAAGLAQEFDAGRRQFYAAIAPILVRLMESHGAQAVLDETSVLLAAQDLNITEAAIAAIDAMPLEAPAVEEQAPAEAPAAPQ